MRAELDTLAGTRRTWREDRQDDAVVLAHLLKTDGLSWLRRMHRAESRVSYLRERRWLIPTEAALLALTEDAIGERAAARARLEELLLDSPRDWESRVRSLLDQL